MDASGIDCLRFAMLNGAIGDTAALRVSPLGPGFMFGEGVFETIRVWSSAPVFFADHYARLAVSLGFLSAPPLSAHDELHARCARVIAANSLVSGNLKLVVFRDTAGWSELILARPGAYGPEDYVRGFQLKSVVCDPRIDPLHALKSLNYLGNIRAKRTALASGCDEALFIDPKRQVLEGATTSVFIVKDRMVRTPSLSCGILPGVMRARVIQMLEPCSVQECDVSLDALLDAEEVFVTNALLGIMPVVRVDQVAYDLKGNPITRALKERCGWSH